MLILKEQLDLALQNNRVILVMRGSAERALMTRSYKAEQFGRCAGFAMKCMAK